MKRLQFSLGSLAMAAVAAGACIGLWFSHRKIAALEDKIARVEELEESLKKMSELASMREKSTVVHYRGNREDGWKWEVFFGEDGKFNWKLEWKNFGGKPGATTKILPLDVHAGFYQMDAHIQRKPNGWTVAVLTLASRGKVLLTEEIVLATAPSDTDFFFFRGSKERIPGNMNSRQPLQMIDITGLPNGSGIEPNITLTLHAVP